MAPWPPDMAPWPPDAWEREIHANTKRRCNDQPERKWGQRIAPEKAVRFNLLIYSLDIKTYSYETVGWKVEWEAQQLKRNMLSRQKRFYCLYAPLKCSSPTSGKLSQPKVLRSPLRTNSERGTCDSRRKDRGRTFRRSDSHCIRPENIMRAVHGLSYWDSPSTIPASASGNQFNMKVSGEWAPTCLIHDFASAPCTVSVFQI